MLALCSIAFIVVASDNSLFGILHNKTIVGIGEISYSLYLIHGSVLYYFTKFLEHLYTESILQAALFFKQPLTYQNTHTYMLKSVFINLALNNRISLIFPFYAYPPQQQAPQAIPI